MTAPARASLPPLTPDTAPPGSATLLRDALRGMGMIPNMYGNMAHLTGLLATYRTGYEAFRAESGFSPAEQEVVLLTISRENGCEYCVAAHSMLSAGPSQVPVQAIQAIREGMAVEDPRLAVLSEFTRTMVRGRGRPSVRDLEAFQSAGYTEQQVLAIILAIGVKIFSNYSNHFFATPVDAAFAEWIWAGEETIGS